MSANGETTEAAVEKKSTAKKVLGIIVNVLLWIFVAFCAFVTILTFTQTNNANNVPAIGNKMIVAVKSDSMKPQPGDDYEVAGFDQGDIIIVRQIDLAEAVSLKEGDVISYEFKDLDGDGKIDLNTHRIVEVNKDESGNTVSYLTQGDNTAGPDDIPATVGSIKGLYEGKKIAWVGNVLLFLQTRLGFGLLVVLPLVIFFVVELILFIRKFLKTKNAGKKKITEADEELIRQRAIEEYIRQQQEKADTVKEEATEAVSEIKEAAEETVSEVKKDAEEAVEKVKDAVTPDKAE